MKESVRGNRPCLMICCIVIISAALLWFYDVIYLKPLQAETFTIHLLSYIDSFAGRPLLWLNAGIVLCILLPFSQLRKNVRKALLAVGICSAGILLLLELSVFTPLSMYHFFALASAKIVKHSAVFCLPGLLIGMGIVKRASAQ